MAERSIDTFAGRLADNTLSTDLPFRLPSPYADQQTLGLSQKYTLAIELRDNIEMLCSGSSYPAFLKKLMPVFMKLLEGPPVFVTNPEHKLRNCVLEILHRLPMSHSEALRPYACGLVDMLLGLVRTENEENVILCMKAIMDLERHQAEITAPKVQPFLDIIQEMFEAMENVVKETFDAPPPLPTTGATPSNAQTFQSPRPSSPAASANSDIGIDTPAIRPLLKGMQSFKVFAECPIIVVSLFQTHRACVNPNVKKVCSSHQKSPPSASRSARTCSPGS